MQQELTQNLAPENPIGTTTAPEQEEEDDMVLKRIPTYRIGYPCANRTKKLLSNHSFRLKSFSEAKLKEVVANNIEDTNKMLQYNLEKNLRFFRIGSEFVPFASHKLCRELAAKEKNPFSWQQHFAKDLKAIGDFVKKHNMRISMHPDHFVKLNAQKEDIVANSISELEYHAELLELMGLDSTHKMQIHVGGVYGDKEESMKRFVEVYNTRLSERVKRHLVVENDDLLYSLDDCMWIHERTKVPILFDTFHHECLNTSNETTQEAFIRAASTWRPDVDGTILVDYSSQDPTTSRVGKHAPSVDLDHFERTVCRQLMTCHKNTKKQAKEGEASTSKPKKGERIGFDVMLEIKDKEKSAVVAEPILERYIQILKQGKQIEPFNAPPPVSTRTKKEKTKSPKKSPKKTAKKTKKEIKEEEEEEIEAEEVDEVTEKTVKRRTTRSMSGARPAKKQKSDK